MPKALTEYEINIGKKVRNYRVTHDYTQEALGEYLRLPKQIISRMENGKRRITIEEVEKIAAFFGEPIQLFLNDDYKYIYPDPYGTAYGPLPVYMSEFLLEYSKGLTINAGKDNLTNKFTNKFIAAIKNINYTIISDQKIREKRERNNLH